MYREFGGGGRRGPIYRENEPLFRRKRLLRERPADPPTDRRGKEKAACAWVCLPEQDF